MSIAEIAQQMGLSVAEVEWLVKYGTPANFAQTLSGGLWKRAKHLSYLSNVIVDAVEGRTPLVLVEVPPRHGKSELISKWTPAWYLNRYPANNVILISYALDFAVQWGRQVRNIIQENEDQLRVKVAKDSSSAQRWFTTAGGRMVSVGAGGPITGIGANLLLVDDPIKNQEEANSQTQRDNLWDWFQSTVFTRIEPGGCCIVLHTRWNMDDLIGRLLESDIPWRRVRFPAIAEEADILGRQPGEALWPERYDVPALDQIKKGVSSYWWSALYQQSPTTRDGGYFQRGWFGYTRKAPERGQTIRFWDLAGTESQGTGDPDYTVGLKMHKDEEGNFTILDVARFRKNPMEVRRDIQRIAAQDGKRVKIWIEQEPGNAGKFLIQQYQKDLEDFTVRGFRATGPKESYYDNASAKTESGRVTILESGWKIREFLDELEAVPHAKHDDQADAFSKAIAVMTMKKRWGVYRKGQDEEPALPVQAPEPPQESNERRLFNAATGEWETDPT